MASVPQSFGGEAVPGKAGAPPLRRRPARIIYAILLARKRLRVPRMNGCSWPFAEEVRPEMGALFPKSENLFQAHVRNRTSAGRLCWFGARPPHIAIRLLT